MSAKIHSLTKIHPSPISFSERSLRINPSSEASELKTPSHAAARQALTSGISLFHGADERAAVSIEAALTEIHAETPLLLSATDDGALSRAPQTEKGAADAVTHAAERMRRTLGVDTLDLFSLSDFRADVHCAAALAGAAAALREERGAGRIRAVGATCADDHDALAEAIARDTLPLDFVIVRFNYLDQRAARMLIPVCRERGIDVIAAETFSWLGGVPFTRFPNIWRYRNMTKNFHGFSVAQAHLRWLWGSGMFTSVLVSMQEASQVLENTAAPAIAGLPSGMESLFESIAEAIRDTDEGWIGLLKDEVWEYRIAAEAELERRRGG